MDLLVAMLKMGIYWLIIGLILHLVCRGLWIGLVGLSYAFPEGIKTEKLNYQPKYLQKVQAVPPFEVIILRLERICSNIYSISFLLFMCLLGAYIFFMVTVITPMLVIVYRVDNLANDRALQLAVHTYAYGFLIFSGIGLVDFLSMGYLRRFPFFAKIFWPIYRVFSFLTLSR